MRRHLAALGSVLCLICLICLICLVLAGCGAAGGETQFPQLGEGGRTAAGEKPEVVTEVQGQQNGQAGQESETPEMTDNEGQEAAQAEVPENANTLAKRLCGKYSCKISDEEFEILELFTFGNNLYAQAGTAMGTYADEDLESYSFWAMELIPAEKDGLTTTEGSGCDLKTLTFSIMSNMGEYWGPARDARIELTEEGLRFDGFSGEGAGEPRIYTPDERVEDTFPYLNGEEQGKMPEGLKGLWKQENTDAPLFLEFSEKGNLRLYRKEKDKKVYFGAGTAAFTEEGVMEVMYSSLGNGSMPAVFSAEYKIGDGTLSVTLTEEETAEESLWGSRSVTLKKAEETEIPVVTLN